MASLRPGAALLPLRLFLGGTFVYAGIQKLSDPGFLHKGANSYIGTQLTQFANGTPAGFLLRDFAIPHAALAGVAVAIGEITIGLLVLLGLQTRAAAAAGLSLNLIFFLTASWKTSPYFLGSDIVFVFAWLPFVLSGAAGQPALDNALERRPEAIARRASLRPPEPGQPAYETEAMTRRTLLAEVGAAAVAIAGISALAKGPFTGTATSATTLRGGGGQPGASGGSQAASTNSGGGGSSTSGGSGAGLPAKAVELGPSSRLPAGQAATYTDPSDGSPDILIRASDGSLKAFSAVCTHAGCTVGYDGSEIVCPCHGGVYSPQTGAVEGGPPPAPLAAKQVVERSGRIYAVPS